MAQKLCSESGSQNPGSSMNQLRDVGWNLSFVTHGMEILILTLQVVVNICWGNGRKAPCTANCTKNSTNSKS